MSQAVGKIVWVDLTVPEADKLRDFYTRVVGWRPKQVDMGDYNDYNLFPTDSEQPAAGVCHAQGMNANLPTQWIVYITVADLEASLAACTGLGGRLVARPRGEPGQRFAVIQDPAGAVCALLEID